jgi:hypothetical protein
MNTELFSYGIIGFLPPIDIISFLLPGKAAHPSQATKLPKTERATSLNQKLGALTPWASRLYTLKTGILTTDKDNLTYRQFVSFAESYKNRQLTQNFGQTVTRNIVESFPQCLYFSITKQQNRFCQCWRNRKRTKKDRPKVKRPKMSKILEKMQICTFLESRYKKYTIFMVRAI